MDERVAEAEPEDSGVLRSDDILAAFRARRDGRRPGDGAPDPASEPEPPVRRETEREAPEAGSGAGAGPEPAEEAPETPAEEPAPQPETAPEPGREPAEEPEPQPGKAPKPGRERAEEPEPGSEAGPEPDPTPRPEEPRERVLPVTADAPALVVPRGSPLTALQPGMGLAERLLADATVTVRGNLMVRTVAAVAAVFGLFILVMERRGARLYDTIYEFYGIVPVATVGWILALLGAAVFAVFLYYPPARTLSVKLAADQQTEWRRVQDEAKTLRILQMLGLGMLAGGLLLALLAYAAFPTAQMVAGAGLGIILAGAGGVLSGVAVARRGAVHRLYVQTLVLSRLEQTGLGVPGRGPDERVAPVLRALDKLLGHLPESAVRGFLQSEHAQAYLDLLEEARDG